MHTQRLRSLFTQSVSFTGVRSIEYRFVFREKVPENNLRQSVSAHYSHHAKEMHTSLSLTDICRGMAQGKTKGSNHSRLGVHVKSFIKTRWLCFPPTSWCFSCSPPPLLHPSRLLIVKDAKGGGEVIRWNEKLVSAALKAAVCNLRTLQSSNLASNSKAFRRKMSSWGRGCSGELKKADNDKLGLIRDKHTYVS